jgi:hypothetical protein
LKRMHHCLLHICSKSAADVSDHVHSIQMM